nr:putative transposase, Ptta/En/Spm, plant [Tanacetum cinerariifolium]
MAGGGTFRASRGTWNAIRAKCKEGSGIVIPSDWTEYCPDDIDQEDWEDILKSWMKPEWQKRSKVGSENRKRVPGVEAGTSSYVRHTGGSTNFRIHLKIM